MERIDCDCIEGDPEFSDVFLSMLLSPRCETSHKSQSIHLHCAVKPLSEI